MWIDNITLIISVLTLLISAVSCLITIKQNYKEIQLKKETMQKIKIDLKLLEDEFREKKNDDIGIYLKRLSNMIKVIYPKSTTTISVKFIRKIDENNLLDSEVITWVTYPGQKYDVQEFNRIKENADIYSIVNGSREYFFVSDLKKYSALTPYLNSEQHFAQEYNTSIVVPIQKERKEKEDIIGFLCINSPQRLGNVKKNKTLIDIIKTAASLFYDYLMENRLNQEAISIKNDIVTHGR